MQDKTCICKLIKRNLRKLFLNTLTNIFDGSRETEDCSNDAENTVLHNRNKLHFKIYSS